MIMLIVRPVIGGANTKRDDTADSISCRFILICHKLVRLQFYIYSSLNCVCVSQ